MKDAPEFLRERAKRIRGVANRAKPNAVASSLLEHEAAKFDAIANLIDHLCGHSNALAADLVETREHLDLLANASKVMHGSLYCEQHGWRGSRPLGLDSSVSREAMEAAAFLRAALKEIGKG